MNLARIERLWADTLYVATAGGMGPKTTAALQAFLRTLAAHPEAMLVPAIDADVAEDHYAARLMEMAARVGVRLTNLSSTFLSSITGLSRTTVMLAVLAAVSNGFEK